MGTVIAQPGRRKSIVAMAFEGLRKAERGAREPKMQIQKEEHYESEPYRRLVASFPCAYCTAERYSQAAHPPPTGKSRKEDDRECFPLCSTRAGKGRKGAQIEGCHPQFDQGKLMPRGKQRTMAKRWARETAEKILAMGKWPKGLPKPDWWTEQETPPK